MAHIAENQTPVDISFYWYSKRETEIVQMAQINYEIEKIN